MITQLCLPMITKHNDYNNWLQNDYNDYDNKITTIVLVSDKLEKYYSQLLKIKRMNY